MSPQQFRDLVGEWMAGSLSASEHAEMEAFVASPQFDTACAQALGEATNAVALLGDGLAPLTPPANGWDAIAKALDRHAMARSEIPRVRVPLRQRWLIAASLALTLGAGWAWSETQRRHLHDSLDQQLALNRTLTAQVETSVSEKQACAALLATLQKDVVVQHEALDILHHNATQLIKLASQDRAAPEHVRAIFNPVAKRAWVVAPSLAPPRGQDYELWVVRGKDRIPAGILRGNADSVLVAAVDPALLASGTPDSFIVTLEAKGGVPSSAGILLLSGAPAKL